jgi:hypothetical protein
MRWRRTRRPCHHCGLTDSVTRSQGRHRLARAGWAACINVGLAVLTASFPAAVRAATYGVPTSLDPDGTTSAASLNPPGWLMPNGPEAVAGRGDLVHQVRLFIEVTGSTLDIRVFDPGASGARDEAVGQGSATNASSTTFTLLSPSGTTVSTSTLGDDRTTGTHPTEDRLVRFTPGNNGFFRLDVVTGNNVPFTGLSAGLYEFRITVTSGDETNTMGVDLRQAASAGGAPYAAYTIGRTASQDSNMITGVMPYEDPEGQITPPYTFFAYVNRGCSIQTSNYDADGAGGMAITDALGATTALTPSGGTVHAENTITVENSTVTNLDVINYGQYRLAHGLGTASNNIDWRVADWENWTDNPAGVPRNPTNPIRMYLPNSYAPVSGNANAVAPGEPILALSARVVSGANPPTAGQTTRFNVTASVDNLSGAALSQLTISVDQAANVTFVAGTQAGFVDGLAATCTDVSAAGFRACRFATLAAGSVATLSFDVNYAPPVGTTGVRDLSGPPAAGSPPPNTTTFATYTPAFSSATFPRTETLGPVCNLTVTVGGPQLPTRATLRGVRVDPRGQVEFVAATQTDTVAYHLYTAPDAQGWSRRTRLTADAVRARGATSLTPVIYRVATAPITQPWLFVEEIDGRGRRHVMGPFAVDDARLAGEVARAETRLDAAGAGERHHQRRLGRGGVAALARTRLAEEPPSPRERGQGAVKIEVARAGRVEVPWADLVQLGLPPAVRPALLRLYSGGARVDFQLMTDGAGTRTGITFAAVPFSTDYTGRNVYVLTWGTWGRHAAPRVPLTRSEAPVPAGFERIKQNAIYVPNAPEQADPWVWDLLLSDEGQWPYASDPDAGTFDLPRLQAGSGTVRVRVGVQGRSNQRHQVTAAINGVTVGALAFWGGAPAVLQGTLPLDALAVSGNRLTLDYSVGGVPAGDLGLLYLDFLDLDAPLSAATDPAPVERLSGLDPRLPPAAGVDYLIVTHPLFRDAAERIASLKQAEGYQTAVVDVERAYDHYSAGVPEARAIQALIRDHFTQARWVLLVGDDTFDPRDDLGTGARTFVPSLLGWDGEFGRVPSEGRYADRDDDGRPDLAIGRLPVQTAQQAWALSEKIARQATVLAGASGNLVAVDNQGPNDVDFRQHAAAVLGPLARSATWADVGQGTPGARATLLAGLESGARLTHYFGHAGPEVWADESLLTVDDVQALLGPGETVLFIWACESQWYQNLLGPSVGEALLLLERGGALASFGPAGITDPARQRELARRVYHRFVRGVPLGEAVRGAKAELLLADPAARAVTEGWNLLGDPALRLPLSAPLPNRDARTR